MHPELATKIVADRESLPERKLLKTMLDLLDMNAAYDVKTVGQGGTIALKITGHSVPDIATSVDATAATDFGIDRIIEDPVFDDVVLTYMR